MVTHNTFTEYPFRLFGKYELLQNEVACSWLFVERAPAYNAFFVKMCRVFEENEVLINVRRCQKVNICC